MCALGLLVLGVFHHPRKRPDKTPNWVADAGAGAVVDATGQERGRLLLWASRNTGRSDKDSATETRHWKLTRGLVEPRVFQGPVVRLREALIYPRTAKVTCTCGLGLDVHPIYWSDALAVEGMVAELRNWSHRSICRLRSLRGGTWVAKSTGPVGRWRGQAQPRESGTRRAPTGLLTTRASRKWPRGCAEIGRWNVAGGEVARGRWMGTKQIPVVQHWCMFCCPLVSLRRLGPGNSTC